MQSNHSRRLAKLSCFAVVLGLAACGGSDSGTSGNPGPAPAPDPAPAPGAIKPLVTPRGAPEGESASGSVGNAGGRLDSPDGRLTITVPEGALVGASSVSIQAIANGAPGRAGVGYRLAPEGVSFAKPVQLRFSYSDADIAGSSADALGVAYQQQGGTWRMVSATVDKAAKTVTANTTHFSDWSLVKGFQLRPPSATIKPAASQALTLTYCYAPVVGDADLMPIGYDCDSSDDGLAPLVPLNQVSNWAVNGAAGGSASLGTVAGGGKGATYTAPAKAPQPNTVAVSADVQDAKGKVMVVANITVADGWAYTGRYQSTTNQAGLQVAMDTSSLRWVLQPDRSIEGDLKYYRAYGMASWTYANSPAPGCASITVQQPVVSNMVVFDPVRAVAAGRNAGKHWIDMAMDGRVLTPAMVKCPDITALQNAAFPGVSGTVCAGAPSSDGSMPGLAAYSDERSLSGTSNSTCSQAPMTFTATWSLAAQPAQ